MWTIKSCLFKISHKISTKLRVSMSNLGSSQCCIGWYRCEKYGGWQRANSSGLYWGRPFVSSSLAQYPSFYMPNGLHNKRDRDQLNPKNKNKTQLKQSKQKQTQPRLGPQIIYSSWLIIQAGREDLRFLPWPWSHDRHEILALAIELIMFSSLCCRPSSSSFSSSSSWIVFSLGRISNPSRDLRVHLLIVLGKATWHE